MQKLYMWCLGSKDINNVFAFIRSFVYALFFTYLQDSPFSLGSREFQGNKVWRGWCYCVFEIEEGTARKLGRVQSVTRLALPGYNLVFLCVQVPLFLLGFAFPIHHQQYFCLLHADNTTKKIYTKNLLLL